MIPRGTKRIRSLLKSGIKQSYDPLTETIDRSQTFAKAKTEVRAETQYH
jgi:hypothetical protein